MYDIDGVSVSGPLLASLLNEAASPYAGTDQRQGTRYTEGLLFGNVIQRKGSETGDTHEKRSTMHREIALSSYVRAGERCEFHDAFGGLFEERLAALLLEGQRLAGYFVIRKGGSTRPSLRELEVLRNIAANPSSKGQPPVILVACLRLREGAPTQSFRYQCVVSQGKAENGQAPGRLEAIPCRINNLTTDSSSEYADIRPCPLAPLGVEGVQEAALREAFGAVPPLHVREAEALFDKGIETMDDLVKELKRVENDVVRLQMENKCMEKVLLARRDSS